MIVEEIDKSRFWSYVRKSDFCWEWIGAKNRTKLPHGSITIKSKSYGTHRFSWMLHFGAIPDGLIVCHKCDNPPCIRPDHLFLGTYKENMQDCVNKGRNYLASRKVCQNGHLFDGRLKNGYRYCRTCKRNKSAIALKKKYKYAK